MGSVVSRIGGSAAVLAAIGLALLVGVPAGQASEPRAVGVACGGFVNGQHVWPQVRPRDCELWWIPGHSGGVQRWTPGFTDAKWKTWTKKQAKGRARILVRDQASSRDVQGLLPAGRVPIVGKRPRLETFEGGARYLAFTVWKARLQGRWVSIQSDRLPVSGKGPKRTGVQCAGEDTLLIRPGACRIETPFDDQTRVMQGVRWGKWTKKKAVGRAEIVFYDGDAYENVKVRLETPMLMHGSPIGPFFLHKLALLNGTWKTLH